MLAQVRNLLLLHMECVCARLGLWGLPQKEVLQVPSTLAQIHCLLLLHLIKVCAVTHSVFQPCELERQQG